MMERRPERRAVLGGALAFFVCEFAVRASAAPLAARGAGPLAAPTDDEVLPVAHRRGKRHRGPRKPASSSGTTTGISPNPATPGREPTPAEMERLRDMIERRPQPTGPAVPTVAPPR